MYEYNAGCGDLLFSVSGSEKRGTIPVALDGILNPDDYINPLPHALMLTAIVVSLGTSGMGLALLMRIKDKYGTLEEDEIIKKENTR